MWGLGWFGQADLHFSGQNRCEGREGRERRAGVLMSRLLVNSAAQRVRESERAREQE